MSYRYTEVDALALKNRNTKARKPPPARQLTEADVTAAIRQILRTCKIWHFKHWAGPMGEKGISDIIGCFNGRMVAIEIKRPGGKATPDQIAFIEAVRAAGGIGFVAWSTEDVIEGLGLQDRFLIR